MQPVLLDTSIYVIALRRGDAALTLNRLTSQAPLWLSAVVLEELCAGASKRDYHVIERLQHDFDRVQRILMPNLNDWSEAGKVLARLAAYYGYEQIGRARLTNDALIAMSAARQGVTIITANRHDFARLAEFRDFRFEVRPV